jgi:hypothetical protein
MATKKSSKSEEKVPAKAAKPAVKKASAKKASETPKQSGLSRAGLSWR